MQSLKGSLLSSSFEPDEAKGKKIWSFRAADEREATEVCNFNFRIQVDSNDG